MNLYNNKTYLIVIFCLVADDMERGERGTFTFQLPISCVWTHYHATSKVFMVFSYTSLKLINVKSIK